MFNILLEGVMRTERDRQSGQKIISFNYCWGNWGSTCPRSQNTEGVGSQVGLCQPLRHISLLNRREGNAYRDKGLWHPLGNWNSCRTWIHGTLLHFQGLPYQTSRFLPTQCSNMPDSQVGKAATQCSGWGWRGSRTSMFCPVTLYNCIKLQKAGF